MPATKLTVTLALLGAAVALPPAALAADAATTQRLNQLESRIDRLDRLVETQLMQMLRRLDSLQADIRALRDRAQRSAHELEQLRARQRELFLGVDERLQAMETEGSDADSDAGSGAQPPGESGSGEAQAGAQPAASDGDDRSAYKQAITLLRDRRYNESAEALDRFLDEHPDSVYADNAQYWLAESHYAGGQWQKAQKGFNTLIEEYPRSDKVAGAILKLGFTHYQLEEWEAARAQLSKVTEEYPDTSAARLAADRLERMRREGHG